MVHMPSLPMMVIIAVIGLLLFGKRLPEVGKSLGKGIVEFKKGLKGIEEEVSTSSSAQANSAQASTATQAKFDPYTGKALNPPDHKFDPYTGKPIEETSESDASHATSADLH
jgi:sec-independent protein translocase protein TatA